MLEYCFLKLGNIEKDRLSFRIDLVDKIEKVQDNSYVLLPSNSTLMVNQFLLLK